MRETGRMQETAAAVAATSLPLSRDPGLFAIRSPAPLGCVLATCYGHALRYGLRLCSLRHARTTATGTATAAPPLRLRRPRCGHGPRTPDTHAPKAAGLCWGWYYFGGRHLHRVGKITQLCKGKVGWLRRRAADPYP